MSIDTAVPPAAALVPVGADRPNDSLWQTLRPLVLRLHFYAGLLCAPFILIAAITGLVYTTTPQVEEFMYRNQLKVAVETTSIPLSQQVDAARAFHPDGDLIEVDPPTAPDRSTRVVFSDETVPTDYNMSVFVDPYTGTVQGEVKSFGQWLGVRGWLDDLHRNLHLGAVGRHYSEFAASWTWVIALGGLALWIGRVRRARVAKAFIVPNSKRGGRLGTLSWHAVVGVWILLGLLALSVSGLTWSRYTGANISEIRTALSWTTPPLNTELNGKSGVPEEHHHGGSDEVMVMPDASAGVGIDGVYAAAVNQGLGAPLNITPPSAEGETWTVGENKRSWPTKYDTIAVDGQTGQVTDRVNFVDWPFMAKLTDWIIGAHMGILFGIPNQLLLASLAVGLITVIVFGYRMWWLRRPTRNGKRSVAPALAPRSLGGLPKRVLIPVALITIFVGVVIPLLGISLLAFLLIDSVLGLLQRRHRPPVNA